MQPQQRSRWIPTSAAAYPAVPARPELPRNAMTTTPLPPDRRYTDVHSWLASAADRGLREHPLRVGITEAAVDGVHVISVELPRIQTAIQAGEPCALIWTTPLSAMPVYAPITGLVAMVNPLVRDDPAIVSRDPLHAGWLFAVLPSDEPSTDQLLTATDYATLLGVVPADGSAVSHPTA
jgi:glycine cleavage system H protein